MWMKSTSRLGFIFSLFFSSHFLLAQTIKSEYCYLNLNSSFKAYAEDFEKRGYITFVDANVGEGEFFADYSSLRQKGRPLLPDSCRVSVHLKKGVKASGGGVILGGLLTRKGSQLNYEKKRFVDDISCIKALERAIAKIPECKIVKTNTDEEDGSSNSED